MSILPSARRQDQKNGVGQEVLPSSTPSVILGEGSLVALAIVRIFLGYLWFQQLFWKLPPSFTGLHSYVVREGQYTFIPGYAFIIQHVFLPNFLLLGAFTWIAEFLVAISLLFGVFSRLGALLSLILAVQLYVGLAVAPGEWYWTYGMLVLLASVFVVLPTGRRLGVDQWLALCLNTTTNNTRFVRIVRWFV
jgi:thiosulfate dehydrogenase [quinone] large subunit